MGKESVKNSDFEVDSDAKDAPWELQIESISVLLQIWELWPLFNANYPPIEPEWIEGGGIHR
jgi:hypothetical protein